MITYEFEFETATGTFKDAIVVPDDMPLTPAQVEEIKQQRFAAWQAEHAPQE